MTDATRFLEIEHKFVVTEDFDPSHFFAKLRALSPENEYLTEVSDSYFLLKAVPNLVYRHRYDGLIQQLTTKSVASRDSETRTEINLDLKVDQNLGDAIEAFLEPFGIEWSGTLKKKVQVFYYPDVEIVFYRATYRDRSVSCIELEARKPKSIESAVKTLERWEQQLGLVSSDRSHLSLLHLLILDTLPTKLKEKLACM